MSEALRTDRTISPALIDKLKDVVGPAGFLEGANDTGPYCQGWREDYHGAVPLVLRPQSTADVARIVKLCAETGTAIVPQGGNTGLTGASQPHDDMSEVIISTQRMNQIREIDLDNDTLTVEAGVVLQQIQKIARTTTACSRSVSAPKAPVRSAATFRPMPAAPRCCATATRAASCSVWRRYLPNGEIWSQLRGLRKDNTGYDLKHLFIGAEGTLGIITAAVVKLFPRPTATETIWLGLKSPEHAVKLLGHMRARLATASPLSNCCSAPSSIFF